MQSPLVSEALLREEARLKFLRRDLLFVHVGKCGGSTVRQALRESPILERDFRRLRRYHFEAPPLERTAKYLFVTRDPIERAISAFNYRYYHVVMNGREVGRFAGEHEVLLKYGNLNSLAENLFVSGSISAEVVDDFNHIHHLGDESLSFYLKSLLPGIKESQVVGVLRTEKLDLDIMETLGVAVERKRVTSNKVAPEMKYLSPLALSNLRQLLVDDYYYFEKLEKLRADAR